MERIRNKYLALMLFMLLTAVLVKALSYDVFHKAKAGVQAVENIPKQIGKLEGRDVPLESLVYEILETKSIVHRRYTSDSQEVFLSIVYYPETKVDFHAPEACLGGEGKQISKTAKDIVFYYEGKEVKIGLNKLIWESEGSRNLVFYFYKAGEFMGRNYIKLRFNLAINKFFSKEKSGALIRVSTTVVAGKDHEASVRLSAFIEKLYPFLMEYL